MKYKIFSVLGLLIFISLAATETSFAQRIKKKPVQKELSIYDLDTLQKQIPLQRQTFHDKIDRAQKRADYWDGYEDGIVSFGEDTLLTKMLSQTLFGSIDQLEVMIENLPVENAGYGVNENQVKIMYLRALNALLNKFLSDTKVDPIYYKRLVVNFRELLIARQENRLMDFVRSHGDIYTLGNKDLLEGFPEAVSSVYISVGKQDPVKMIRKLADFAKEPFACDIIAAAAKVVPNEVFNFATSSNYVLSQAVRNCNDPLVQTIVRIVMESNAPLKALPFLNDIFTKKKTIAEIDAIVADPELFYKNLVRLKLENETLANVMFTSELQYRGLRYIRKINELHEEKDPVRFQCIEKLSPQELYFLSVYGQDEIYTSSFVRGTFDYMMKKMDSSLTGDKLLEQVHRDKFRTFIRMCAGYNTLSKFLATMTAEKKTALMKDFIADLNKGSDEELEDAVDVADAFGSINDAELLNFLKNEVTKNYERSFKEKSMKGMRIYALLSTLFEGLNNNTNDAAIQKQSEILNLPPINLVRGKNLVNDSGRVYEQFFFYGDEDGKSSYNSFMAAFKDAKTWKILKNEHWTTLTSVAGKPVTIFANNPIPEPGDELAQEKLAGYLSEKEIYPTIIVHRGHSYHLPSTLEKLTINTRIVVLGSCGGYHNLTVVLDKSPDAHIISSKQTGAMNVNEPIVKAINERLLKGEDINWISMWKELNIYFQNKPALKETFSDYIPPHRNLGAIFIKAYRKLLNADESASEN